MAEKNAATERVQTDEQTRDARRAAENESTVKVDLENTVGVSRGPYAGKLYGPGKGVEMPAGLAEILGLKATSKRARAAESEGEGEGEGDPNADVQSMTRDELEAEAERLEIDINDGRGENADGRYSVEQLRRKITRKRNQEADE